MPTLKNLDLTSNVIPNLSLGAAQCLARGLRNHPSLSILILSKMQLGDTAAIELAKVSCFACTARPCGMAALC